MANPIIAGTIPYQDSGTADAAEGPALAPPEVPGYEIQGVLGLGGMGVVYRARQVELNRVVALKMILAGGHASEEDIRRFLAEAEAVAALQHNNIVRIFAVGRHQGLPFMALELAEGGTLADRLKGGPLLPREAARIVELAAHGMNAAHQAGLVHRDLKPGNILLSRKSEISNPKSETEKTENSDFVPKITDFGLARRVKGDANLTRSGAIMGTPGYMAPEQARGESKRVGPAADVYALGAVLYECLTGAPLFQGKSDLEILLKLVDQEPVPPRKIFPNVPCDLETICLKCLHKQPQKRYASAEALAEDLRRWQAGEPITARRVGRAERLIKWVRRKPLAAALVVVLGGALALLTAAGIFAYQQQLALAQEQLALGKEQSQRLAESYLHGAELAAQRGQWQGVLHQFDQLTELGFFLRPEHRLLKAKALAGINQQNEALLELRQLRQQPLGALSAAVDLEEGSLLLGVDDKLALELIHRSLAGNLPPAEKAYAQGIISTDPVKAVAHFQEALDTDPLHRGARAFAAFTLALGFGEVDQARGLMDQGEFLFPEDPVFLAMNALCYGLLQKPKEAEKRITLLAKSLPPDEVDSIRLGVELFPKVSAELKAGLSGQPPPELLKMLQIMSGNLNMAGKQQVKLWEGAKDKAGQVERWPVLRFPPVLKEYAEAFQWYHSHFLNIFAPDPIGDFARDQAKVAKLRHAAETYPEAYFRYHYGTILMTQALGHPRKTDEECKGRMKLIDEAAEAFQKAWKSKSWIDVHVPSLDGYIYMLGMGGSPKFKFSDPKKTDLAVKLIYERWKLEEIPQNHFLMFGKVAYNGGDFNLARIILDCWEKHEPDDKQAKTLRAEVEFQAKAYGAALKAAQAMLKLEPNNQDMQKIAAKSRQHLEAQLKNATEMK